MILTLPLLSLYKYWILSETSSNHTLHIAQLAFELEFFVCILFQTSNSFFKGNSPFLHALIVIWLMLILIWIMLIFRTSEGLWWKSAYAKFFWIFFKLRTSENRTTENRISQGLAVVCKWFYNIFFDIQTFFARKISSLKRIWPRNPTVLCVLRLGVAKRRQKNWCAWGHISTLTSLFQTEIDPSPNLEKFY